MTTRAYSPLSREQARNHQERATIICFCYKIVVKVSAPMILSTIFPRGGVRRPRSGIAGAHARTLMADFAPMQAAGPKRNACHTALTDAALKASSTFAFSHARTSVRAGIGKLSSASSLTGER
jgi:hypothetical protein